MSKTDDQNPQKRRKRQTPPQPQPLPPTPAMADVIDDPYHSDPSHPSTYVFDFWVRTRRQVGAYPEDTENTGKWMVFVPVEEVDMWWATIKQAVEQGKLGQAAKVSTAFENPHATNKTERVIIVYTYDGYDKVDVMRVRGVLRDLGVTWPISYKLDSATLAGQYAATGARVSLYRV